MKIRINLSGDLRRSLQAHVEVESDFGEERQVGTKARRDDHSVRGFESASVLGDEHRPTVFDEDPLGTESGDEVDEAILDYLLRSLAQGTALRQFVSGTAAEGVADGTAAQRPGHPGARLAADHCREVADRGRGRVAAADHDDVLACQFGGLLAARRAVIK